MEVEEIKEIEYMSDFADLFLAIYSLKKIDDNNMLYISKYFNDIIRDVMLNYEFNNPSLLDEQGLFNIDKFLEKLKPSTVKKFWRDDFIYDMQKDCIFTKVNLEIAQIKSIEYNDENTKLMHQIVDEVIETENEINELQSKVGERKYTLLNKRSND